MNSPKLVYIKRLIAVVVIALVGYFFYISLANNWQEVREISFTFNTLSLIAIMFFTLAVIVTGWSWGRILNEITKRDNKKVPNLEAIRVHVSSWLLKYIPGQAGSLLNKVMWAKKAGYGKKLVLVSFIYENVLLLIASFVLSVPILLIAVGGDIFVENPAYTLLPLLSVVVLGGIVNKRTLHYLINKVFTKILKQSVTAEIFLDTVQLVKLQLYFLVPRVINGIGFVCVVASFLDISAIHYLPLAAAYILAGAVGILAIFVPSGIGVREAVIVIFVTQFLPLEQAIVAAVVARLYSTIADGVLAFVYLALNINKKKGVV